MRERSKSYLTPELCEKHRAKEKKGQNSFVFVYTKAWKRTITPGDAAACSAQSDKQVDT